MPTPKKSKATAPRPLTLTEVVQRLEKEAETLGGATDALKSRTGDLVTPMKKVTTSDEVKTESNIASRLAKVLHRLTEDRRTVEHIAKSIDV